MRSSFVPMFLTALSLVACGGGGGKKANVDANQSGTDSSSGGPDAAEACSVSTASFGDKGVLPGSVTFSADPANAASYSIVAATPLETAPPSDLLALELFTGFTPFGTSAAPTPVVAGTYELTGEQLDYATCGVCVRLLTNVAADGMFEHDYFPTGGTLTITEVGDAVGETFAYSLSNVQWQHVNIDSATFATTSAGDGCTTSMSNASFSGVVAAPTFTGTTPVRAIRKR